MVVRGTTLDYLFGPGCVKALRAAQKEDKLWRQVRERPEKFKNIGTPVGEYGDDLLRIDGRLVIPKTFTWNNRPFHSTLIDFTHSEHVHVGVRAMLKGLFGYICDNQYSDVEKSVKECDQCQRAKHRTMFPYGSHRAMPIRLAGFKDVAWYFIGPFFANKEWGGKQQAKTAVWTILSRGTGYVIMIPIGRRRGRGEQ